nr:DNA directed RNA polymerase beta subunit a [Halimeda borneensis]
MFLLFYKFLFFLSDFLEIQRKSFYLFLNFGLGQPFRLQSYFLPIDFLHENYKFTKPTLNIKQSILFGKTYCCHFYIPIQSGTRSTPASVKIKWILLGTLPLLTRRGHFIINGTPRIVLNQIVRSTGIYFQKGHEKSHEDDYTLPEDRIFYAEIILKRGSWIQFEIDSQKRIWVSQQNKPRFFLSNFFELNSFSFYEQKFNLINNFLKLNENERLYLGKNGRNRLNKKLGLCLKASVLTPIDILTISNILLRSSGYYYSAPKRGQRFALGKPRKLSGGKQNPMNYNLNMEQSRTELFQGLLGSRAKTKVEGLIVDDIDNLKNRRLKTIGELLQDQLIRGLQRLQIIFKNNSRLPSTFSITSATTGTQPILQPLRILEGEAGKRSLPGGRTAETEQELRRTKNLGGLQPINSTFKEFFHSHQLSQYLDQSNPLSEITHKRRLSCGGLNLADAGQAFGLRSIHQTHYGRICPIETPEGKNAGLVNSLTTAVRLNSYGFLETPFIEVYKQHLQNQKRLSFLSVEMQEKRNPFFNQKFPKQKTAVNNVSIGILENQGAISYESNSINFLAKSAQQFLSIATTCIPFIEHDDANRALMGSNMQRQALPLIFLEAPILSTLNAFRVLSDLKDIPTSPKSGFIMYISKKKISLIFLNRHHLPLMNSQIKTCSQAHYINFQQLQYNVD